MTRTGGTAIRQVGIPPINAEETALRCLCRDVRQIQKLVFDGETALAAVHLERLATRLEDKLDLATLERQSQ